MNIHKNYKTESGLTITQRHETIFEKAYTLQILPKDIGVFDIDQLTEEQFEELEQDVEAIEKEDKSYFNTIASLNNPYNFI